MSTATGQASALEPGTVLGRYEILRHIGAGATGELYAARTLGSEGISQLVALKRLRPSAQANSEAARGLLDEARILANLRHPNIAQVYDADAQGASPFIVLEYVQGESLAAVLSALGTRGRGLNLGAGLWIVCNVAAALHHAHSALLPDGQNAGIVHRDVCPSNVLITPEGHVKLIDFGVAKAKQRQLATAPGIVKGHLRYLSPEQYLQADVDGRSDVFALGIVLFELTTGTRWLRERDDTLALQQMLTGRYPKPSERRAAYPAGLERIVERALERNRDRRYDSARSLQLELERFASREQIALSNLTLSETMRSLFGPAGSWSTQRLVHELSQQFPPQSQSATPGGTLRIDSAASAPHAADGTDWARRGEVRLALQPVAQSGKTVRLDRDEAAVAQPRRGSPRLVLVGLVALMALLTAWWARRLG